MPNHRRRLIGLVLALGASLGLTGCASEYSLPSNTPARTHRPSGYYGLAKATPPEGRSDRQRVLDEWLRGKKPPSRGTARHGDVSDRSNQTVDDLDPPAEPTRADDAFDPGSDPTYVVGPGETLWTVARKHNVSVEDLSRANRIDDPSRVTVGNRLVIPRRSFADRRAPAKEPASTPDDASPRGTFYTVKKGDTVLALSRRFGVSTQEIEKWNPREVREGLPSGSTLYLPTMNARQIQSRKKAPPVARTVTPRKSNQVTRVASFRPTPTPIPTTPLPPSSKARPAFVWPVAGTVISKFGNRHGKPHTGVDIKAAEGTPIRAATGGKVIYSGVMRGYGKVIILDHQNGYFTVYGHNERNLVKRSTTGLATLVKRGQMIATVGKTGNATVAHVHFEVRRSNNALDPLKFLPKKTVGPVASRTRTRPSTTGVGRA